jgi:hypothetical protein
MHDGKLPDAHRYFRRYLWQSRISGHLQDEFEARKLLGDLYQAAGEAEAALGNYIRSGALKDAVRLAKGAPPSDVGEFFGNPAPWIAATAIGVFAARGDLAPEAVVADVAPELIRLTNGVRQGRSGPQVGKEAWAALAAVALQLPPDAVGSVLDRIEPLIEREPGRYRPMDESLVQLLVAFHQAAPHARERVSEQLVRCLSVAELFQDLMSYLPRGIQCDDRLKTAIVERASRRERLAIEVLAAAGSDHPEIGEEARRRLVVVDSYEVGKPPSSFSWPSGFEEAGGSPEHSRLRTVSASRGS